MPYEYKVIVKRVVDGDTVIVDVDLGFGIWMQEQTVRVIGINAPETRTTDTAIKNLGIQSKHRVEELLPVGVEVILRSVKGSRHTDAKDKYGRILGDFIVAEQGSMADLMLKEGLAKIYT